MPPVNRIGKFKGIVTRAVVGELGQNSLLSAQMTYRLYEEYVEGEWRNVEAEDLTVEAVYWIEKKDGSLNEYTINNLKQVFGWHGVDPWELESAVDAPAILTLEEETYEGKTRLRVQWTNHIDDEFGGGMKPASDSDKKRIMARVGSKLRALNGGTPAPAPAKPAVKPTVNPAVAAAVAPKPAAPAPKPAPKPPVPTTEPPVVLPTAVEEPVAEGPAPTLEECWNKLVDTHPDENENALVLKWQEMITQIAGEYKNDLTEDELRQLMLAAEVPF